MRPRVTLVYAYYDNPDMLRRQFAEWMQYPDEFVEQVEFIVVDDASPKVPAMAVALTTPVPMNLSIYRVQVDKPWGQDGARNIGMFNCATDWALLSDMDHLLGHREIVKLLGLLGRARAGSYFMPMRVKTSGELYHPHPNSFVFNKSDFWAMGGYDEDFVGFYGSDGNFRKCARGCGLREVLVEDFRLMLFGTNDVPDANTKGLTRKEGPFWAAKDPVLNAKRMGPPYRAINPLRAAYSRVL